MSFHLNDQSDIGREAARLHCLSRMRILDTAAEEAFDSITRAAARYFKVPIALVSLVDQDRQWFKSRVGLDVCETERRHSFCSHAIARDDLLVVNDASARPEFADNPLVTGPPYIRFYAGALVRIEGKSIGTLCIIDSTPRTFEIAEQRDLSRMARLVTRQIKLNARQASKGPFHQLAEGA